METNNTASPDLSTALPGELGENPDELLNNDPEYQDWIADHEETTLLTLVEQGEFDKEEFPW